MSTRYLMATSINHDQMGSVYGFQSIHIKKWGLKHVLDTSIYDSKVAVRKQCLYLCTGPNKQCLRSNVSGGYLY